jgi:hypothetical protein
MIFISLPPRDIGIAVRANRGQARFGSLLARRKALQLQQARAPAGHDESTF